MNYRKPPVSSSIGIEVKAPKGVTLEGDTVVVPKTEQPYAVYIKFYDENKDFIQVSDLSEAEFFCKNAALNGYLFKLVDYEEKYRYYLPSQVRSLVVERLR